MQMKCFVFVWSISKMMRINCSTFWCGVGLHQNVKCSESSNLRTVKESVKSNNKTLVSSPAPSIQRGNNY